MRVRLATPSDAAAIARVHVLSWQSALFEMPFWASWMWRSAPRFGADNKQLTAPPGVSLFVNLRLGRSFEALKEINRRAGPAVPLVLLVAAVMLAHLVAMAQVDSLENLTEQQPRVAARVHFVDYVNSHPHVTLPYIAAFAGGVVWMRFRKPPRWSLWLALALLALPLVGYIWICFRISAGGFTVICR